MGFFDLLDQVFGASTALHHAARDGDLAKTQRLLNAGVGVNARDRNGLTPLHWATGHNHPKVVRLLLDAGADVNARDNYGRMFLDFVADHGVKRLEIVQLMLDAGMDVHVWNDEGMTPLHVAVMEGYSHETIQRLLDTGADVHARDDEGLTPLHIAPYYGDPEVVRLLLDAGGDVHVRDDEGITPRESITQIRRRLKRRRTHAASVAADNHKSYRWVWTKQGWEPRERRGD